MTASGTGTEKIKDPTFCKNKIRPKYVMSVWKYHKCVSLSNEGFKQICPISSRKGSDVRNIYKLFVLVLANFHCHEKEVHLSKGKTGTLLPRFQHLFNIDTDKQLLQDVNSSL